MLESLLSFSRVFSINVFDLLNADYGLVATLMKVGAHLLEEERREVERANRESTCLGASGNRVLTDELEILSYLKGEEVRRLA